MGVIYRLARYLNITLGAMFFGFLLSLFFGQMTTELAFPMLNTTVIRYALWINFWWLYVALFAGITGTIVISYWLGNKRKKLLKGQ